MTRSGTRLVCAVGLLLIVPAVAALGALNLPWAWRGASAQVDSAKKLMFEDTRQAETLLRQAAQTGYPEAEGLLGNLLLARCRLDPSARVEVKVEALKWITLGARHNDRRAQADLASVCFEGRFVQQNFVQAWMWGELAAQSANSDVAQAGRSIRDAAALKMAPEDLALARRKVSAFTFGFEKGDYTAQLKQISPQYAAYVLIGVIGSLICLRLAWRAYASRPRRRSPGRAAELEISVAEEQFYRVLKQALPINIILALRFPLLDVVRPRTKLKGFIWRTAFRNAARGRYVRCALRDVESLRVVAAFEVYDAESPAPERDRFVEAVLCYNQIPIISVAAQSSYSVNEITRQLEDLLGRSIEAAPPEPRSGLKMAKAVVL